MTKMRRERVCVRVRARVRVRERERERGGGGGSGFGRSKHKRVEPSWRPKLIPQSQVSNPQPRVWGGWPDFACTSSPPGCPHTIVSPVTARREGGCRQQSQVYIPRGGRRKGEGRQMVLMHNAR